jgi:uncharacterized protein YigA (DUF484 family)
MSQNESLDELNVAEYLAAHPDFFRQHSELLASMYVPAQNGTGTISLVERQQQAQRDKIRQMENNYANLLRIGNQNDKISQNMHKFTLDLFACKTQQDCLQSVSLSMQQIFNVDACEVRLLSNEEDAQQNLAVWVNGLSAPYCGNSPVSEIRDSHPEHLQSFACIPLQVQGCIGLLVLASEQDDRFYPEMGTMFLQRIGELVSLALNNTAKT